MNASIQKFQDRLTLLQSVKADDKGLWGAMSAQNMIEHIGGIIFGTSKGMSQKLVLPPEKAAQVKSKFFNAYYPFPKNVRMPNAADKPAEAPPHRYDNMETAQNKLGAAAANFLKVVATNPEQSSVHGYFGDLKITEWLHFHIKHMEHHLMQFGKLPPADEKIIELEKLLYKLNKSLTASSPAQWGQMNAHQMVEHLGLVFLLSTGKFDFPYTGTEEQAKKNWQGFVEAEDPWMTVFKQTNFGKPRPTRKSTIEESKMDLFKSFQKYLAYCEANPDAIHPQFYLGNLTVDQWRQVHVKHVKHHLKQFGVLE